MKTNLETEVRECLAKGLSYGATASHCRELGLTTVTGLKVKAYHVANLAHKLALNVRASTKKPIVIKPASLEQKIVRSSRLSNDTKVAVLAELLG